MNLHRRLGRAVAWGLATVALVCGGACYAASVGGSGKSPVELVSVKRIWDQGGHNAFTGLIRHQGRWLCTFREADGHVKGDGKLRVITSGDGETWTSAALLAEEGVDLRDPKISAMPDGRLMIVAGGSVYRGGKLVGRQPRVAFSKDGRQWTPTQRVLSEGEWLWRVTWHKGKVYGVSYNANIWKREKKPCQTLFVGSDGVHYEKVCTLDTEGYAGETTLRFLPDDTMIALVRRESGDKRGWIGTSKPPYTDWRWHKTDYHLGGPDFIILPDGTMWAGSRDYTKKVRTVLARFSPTCYEPVLTLPSGGDTSYPGLVWHDGLLWMSYYSSHEGKTSIYLAKIRPGAASSSARARQEPQDVSFVAKCDGTEQRYILVLPEGFEKDQPHGLLIGLHGHGSDRWQFIKHPPNGCRAIRDMAAKHRLILVTPDYRAKTSWMGPKAEADVVQIIEDLKRRYRIDRVLIVGGSMGGASCLTFAVRHPELVDGVGSMNGTANHLEYTNFQDAIRQSFGGTKTEIPLEYKNRSAEYWPERLTMPVGITASGRDKSVPPDSVLRLANVLKQMKRPVRLIYRPEEGHRTRYADAVEMLEFVIKSSGASSRPAGATRP